MKKLISLFLVILILCALSSCAVTSPDESQGDTATLATAGASSQAAPPSELPSDSDKAEADNAAAVPDHDSLLRNLGALAVSGGWADPGDVSAEDLLIWFGSRALQNFSGDMSQYEVEGKDCLYFPCFVFESEVYLGANNIVNSKEYDSSFNTTF